MHHIARIVKGAMTHSIRSQRNVYVESITQEKSSSTLNLAGIWNIFYKRNLMCLRGFRQKVYVRIKSKFQACLLNADYIKTPWTAECAIWQTRCRAKFQFQSSLHFVHEEQLTLGSCLSYFFAATWSREDVPR